MSSGRVWGLIPTTLKTPRWLTFSIIVSASAAAFGSAEKAVDPRVNDILMQVERARDGVKDLSCQVKFVEDDRTQLVKRVKEGQIRFLSAEPNPLFLIHFRKVIADVQNNLAGKQEWYLFDGRWLHEANERIQQVTKRELARSKEKIDFFDLERAPFPLPFGQKRDVILRNFEVTLVPPAPSDPPDTDHLICIPKPTSSLRERFDQLDFFILRSIHLPARIVAIKNKRADINTADFVDLNSKAINVGLSKKDFVPQPEWKKYKEVAEELPPP